MAASDLDVSYPENGRLAAGTRPHSDTDRLIVAGDVGEVTDEITEDFTWAPTLLRDRFDTVIWAPGNHELRPPVRRILPAGTPS